MAELGAVDLKVRKAVGEAEKGLVKLFKEIGPTNFDIQLKKLNKAKIMAARKKVSAFMTKFMPITKLQGSPVYAQLDPSTQLQVDWMDMVMSSLQKDRSRI